MNHTTPHPRAHRRWLSFSPQSRTFHKATLTLLLLTPLPCFTSLTPPARAAEPQNFEKADASLLSGARLPANVSRTRSGAIFSQMEKALSRLVTAAKPGARQGRTEVLAWTGDDYEKKRAGRIIDETHGILSVGGWTVRTEAIEGGSVLLSARRETPASRTLLGLWVPDDGALVLAWTEVLSDADKTQTPPTEVQQDEPKATHPPGQAGATVLEVDPDAMFVDVMQGAAPKMPSFRRIEKKPGFLRGLVKDSAGRPLKGAKIAVTSTAIGGAETQVSATSDEQGLYEVELPMGACKVWTAGYALTIGGVRCALPLHPADDEFDSFSSRKGDVENLVLLPYGVANAAEASQYPQLEDNYYGGTFTGVYWSGAAPEWLPEGSTLEISLSPVGALIDGRTGRSFVIRHRVRAGGSQNFKVNNIPAGAYKISARLLGGGGALRIEEYNKAPLPGGLKPKSATGSASFLPRPKTADAKSPVVHVNGWRSVLIEFKRAG